MNPEFLIDPAVAEKSLRNIQIPPRPKLLADIDQELKRDDPDIGLLCQSIAKDVSLAAAVLKVINSPFFGLQKKVGAVAPAVHMLGIKNIKCLVSGLILRQSIQGEAASLERFWDSAEKVARISAHVASLLPRVPRDEAYTFGLFRDIGIPMLMQRFPGYRDTLRSASGLDTPLTEVEEEVHGTNHAIIGYMFARTWALPEAITEGILVHHDPAALSETFSALPLAKTLVAINYLAEHLNDSVLRMKVDPQWASMGARVQDYLGISATEIEELKNAIEDF
ncbi:MAG: HDOD domain-containing protein [Methylobacterium sp.]|nr:HDOD domain-containing protein [Methylobacterium sp.]